MHPCDIKHGDYSTKVQIQDFANNTILDCTFWAAQTYIDFCGVLGVPADNSSSSRLIVLRPHKGMTAKVETISCLILLRALGAEVDNSDLAEIEKIVIKFDRLSERRPEEDRGNCVSIF